jgi:hypothetical protein
MVFGRRGFMETAFWLLFVAFIGAVTTLAYKSPNEYRNLSLYLIIAIAVITIGAMIYATGYIHGAGDASVYARSHPSGNWLDPSPFPFDGFKALICASLLWVYLYMLNWLRVLLGSEQPRVDPNKIPQERHKPDDE